MKWTLPAIIFPPGRTEKLEALISYIGGLTHDLQRMFFHAIDLRNNVKGVFIEVVSHASADTEFTVDHNLGVIPFIYFWNTDETGMVYDSRRSDWTSSQLFLKCAGTSANLRLFIFG